MKHWVFFFFSQHLLRQARALNHSRPPRIQRNRGSIWTTVIQIHKAPGTANQLARKILATPLRSRHDSPRSRHETVLTSCTYVVGDLCQQMHAQRVPAGRSTHTPSVPCSNNPYPLHTKPRRHFAPRPAFLRPPSSYRQVSPHDTHATKNRKTVNYLPSAQVELNRLCTIPKNTFLCPPPIPTTP